MNSTFFDTRFSFLLNAVLYTKNKLLLNNFKQKKKRRLKGDPLEVALKSAEMLRVLFLFSFVRMGHIRPSTCPFLHFLLRKKK